VVLQTRTVKGLEGEFGDFENGVMLGVVLSTIEMEIELVVTNTLLAQRWESELINEWDLLDNQKAAGSIINQSINQSIRPLVPSRYRK
jgi:hypothetical protein